MSKFNVEDTIFSVTTEEEVDKGLELSKKQNPEKYAIKLARGEFDAYRSKLKALKPSKTAEKVAEEVTVPKKRSTK
jgi:hypothetical protein